MTLDVDNMDVKELRNALADTFGHDPEELKDVRKNDLKDMLREAIQEEETVENIDFGEDDTDGDFVVEEIVDEETAPTVGTAEWHEYVMSQFIPEELNTGNPTVDGLRRVAELLIAPIRSIETKMVQVPTQLADKNQYNDRRATAIVTVTFQDDTMFDGAADAYWGNVQDKIYAVYPVALAETRAEGRALKRALRLRKVNAAEEIGAAQHDPTPSVENVEEGLMTTMQVNCINVMAGRLSVNVPKVAELLGIITAPKLWTHPEAVAITAQLNKFQNQTDEIPKSLIGFVETWY